MSGGFQLRFKFLSPSFDWDIAECLKISPDWKQVKQLQAPNNSNSGTQCFKAFVFIFGNWGKKETSYFQPQNLQSLAYICGDLQDTEVWFFAPTSNSNFPQLYCSKSKPPPWGREEVLCVIYLALTCFLTCFRFFLIFFLVSLRTAPPLNMPSLLQI